MKAAGEPPAPKLLGASPPNAIQTTLFGKRVGEPTGGPAVAGGKKNGAAVKDGQEDGTTGEIKLDALGDHYCAMCGYTVDTCAKGTKLVGKQPQKYQCGRCNSVASALTREFGKGWRTEFDGLINEAEEKEFWKN